MKTLLNNIKEFFKKLVIEESEPVKKESDEQRVIFDINDSPVSDVNQKELLLGEYMEEQEQEKCREFIFGMDRKWLEAMIYVEDRIEEVKGTPFGFAFEIECKRMLNRCNRGERTDELYRQMVGC